MFKWGGKAATSATAQAETYGIATTVMEAALTLLRRRVDIARAAPITRRR